MAEPRKSGPFGKFIRSSSEVDLPTPPSSEVANFRRPWCRVVHLRQRWFINRFQPQPSSVESDCAPRWSVEAIYERRLCVSLIFGRACCISWRPGTRTLPSSSRNATAICPRPTQQLPSRRQRAITMLMGGGCDSSSGGGGGAQDAAPTAAGSAGGVVNTSRAHTTAVHN